MLIIQRFFETINFHFPTNVCKVYVYYLWFFSTQKDTQTNTYVKHEKVNNDAHTQLLFMAAILLSSVYNNCKSNAMGNHIKHAT